MKIVKLSDVCEVIAGQSPPSSTYNSTGEGIPFFQGKADFGYLFPIVRFWCSAPQKIALPGDILISVRAPVGPTNINISKSCIGRGLSAIRCSNSIDNKFLLYFLRSNEESLANRANGSTFSAITQKDLQNLEVPFPPLATQQKITAILDAADAYRQKTKALMEKYDQLAQSLFLEMFGDPVKNPKGWEEVTIRDLVREVKYGTSDKAGEKGAYPYLRMNNITYQGYMDLTDLKYIDISTSVREKYLVRKGDVIFNRTNSKELVGKTGLITSNDEMVIAGYLIRIRVNEFANPYYLWAHLNSKWAKLTLMNMCKNIVGMANINAQEMQNIKILKAPINLQNQFADRIQLIEAQKQQAQATHTKAEELFNSLLQRAFKGELVE